MGGKYGGGVSERGERTCLIRAKFPTGEGTEGGTLINDGISAWKRGTVK